MTWAWATVLQLVVRMPEGGLAGQPRRLGRGAGKRTERLVMASSRLILEMFNQPTAWGHEASALRLDSPAIQLIVHGHAEDIVPYACRLRWFAMARMVIEAALKAYPKDEAIIHLYDDDATAVRVLGRSAGFIHLPTMTIHVARHHSCGHELTHFLCHRVFGGAARSRLVSEGLAHFLRDPVRRIDPTLSPLAATEEGRCRLTRTVCTAGDSHRPAWKVIASFVGFLLEEYGPDGMGTLWNLEEPFVRAIPATYGHTLEQVLVAWLSYLCHRVRVVHDTEGVLRAANVIEEYRPCVRCRNFDSAPHATDDAHTSGPMRREFCLRHPQVLRH